MSKYSLYSQLPRTVEDVDAHIRALSRMTAEHEHSAVFDHLYECLSILDSKSSSLLSFNSIIIAVFAIFTTETLAQVEWLIISVGMAAVLASAFLLLSVVWVHWSTTEDLGRLKSHGMVLLMVRRGRTVKYRLAWWLSVISMIALSAFFAFYVVSGVAG
jgi:hypothetical protein